MYYTRYAGLIKPEAMGHSSNTPRGLQHLFALLSQGQQKMEETVETWLEKNVKDWDLGENMTKIWNKMGKYGKHMETYGKIWETYGRKWENVGNIWKHMGKYEQKYGNILDNMRKYGHIWENRRNIWKHMGKYEKVWQAMCKSSGIIGDFVGIQSSKK